MRKFGDNTEDYKPQAGLLSWMHFTGSVATVIEPQDGDII